MSEPVIDARCDCYSFIPFIPPVHHPDAKPARPVPLRLVPGSARCPRKWTLSIGLAAFAAQATACTASFLWGSSAVKVFLAEAGVGGSEGGTNRHGVR